jgi:membrane-bound ClpP family serine protease
MKLLLLIGILAAVGVLALLVVVALYQHKKAGVGDIRLLGEIAQVDTALEPEGTVIVCGELWRARSKTAAHIPARSRVRIIGFEDHFALVEVCD